MVGPPNNEKNDILAPPLTLHLHLLRITPSSSSTAHCLPSSSGKMPRSVGEVL